MSEQRVYFWGGTALIIVLGVFAFVKIGPLWALLVVALSLLCNSAGICEGMAKAETARETEGEIQ